MRNLLIEQFIGIGFHVQPLPARGVLAVSIGVVTSIRLKVRDGGGSLWGLQSWWRFVIMQDVESRLIGNVINAIEATS